MLPPPLSVACGKTIPLTCIVRPEGMTSWVGKVMLVPICTVVAFPFTAFCNCSKVVISSVDGTGVTDGDSVGAGVVGRGDGTCDGKRVAVGSGEFVGTADDGAGMGDTV